MEEQVFEKVIEIVRIKQVTAVREEKYLYSQLNSPKLVADAVLKRSVKMIGKCSWFLR